MAIETLEGVLAEHAFFKGISNSHLATLVGCASNVVFPAGEFIFKQGGAAERFYLVRHGVVAVEVFAPGKGAITIETVGEAEVLGWSWLFPPYKWHFDARATTFVRAIAMDGVCLRRKCDSDPVLGRTLMERFASMVIQRLEATQLQLLDLYGK